MIEEENKLAAYRKKLEEVPIDMKKLDEAIQRGIQTGEVEVKRAKRNRRKAIYSLVAVAVLMFAFITSIRVSPAFANAVASIPGMERIVEMIQYDKGIQGIVDNDYYQEVYATDEKDNITLTMHGVIIDETGMIVSYTLEAPYPIENVDYKYMKLFYEDKEVQSSTSYNYPEQAHENRKEDVVEFIFSEPKTFATGDFKVEIALDNAEDTTFTIPFKVTEKAAEGKVYHLNETVEMEGQKMTIDEITIHPLRVAVQVTFDETNTMELLQFEDMRIEDEKGEVWSGIQNGITAHKLEERTEVYYLQSNYFEEPEKLYFKLNEMQALPKDEAYVLIDTNKGEVLKQPSVGDFELTRVSAGFVEGRVGTGEKAFSSAPFSSVENADGEMLNALGGSMWHREGAMYFTESFEKEQIKNPLKLEFFAYPNYIYGDVEIELER